ncbi:hypothetical protein IQ250_23825 [Pseudanabaenaceae cyanobacterium LEGE 13415]|nr:hypothetical protein [Pseudanabaenaceae cyanobacterium LEGE 13415]
MLHSALAEYLDRVEQALMGLENVYVERYVEEILTPQRATLRIRIRFVQGYLLELNEAIVVEADVLLWLDYRYHCQDEQNCLIFRYDSTPHFPNLPTFPPHKHLPDEVIASQKPDVAEVLQEAVIYGLNR